MRWIYVSPHLDDAVLSAGGFIFDQSRSGIPVEIWTIFCGVPSTEELSVLAQYLHNEWGTGTPEETVKLRREEDLRATKIVGAKAVHLNIPDCIYRRGPDGVPLYPEITVQPDEREAGLPDHIAEIISSRLRFDDRIICQFGIGNHVDHVIVRIAMEKLRQPLWYTADIPYLFTKPDELDNFITGMKEHLYEITESGMNAWIKAILAYQSQLSELFTSIDDMKNQIQSYFNKRSGFPIWREE